MTNEIPYRVLILATYICGIWAVKDDKTFTFESDVNIMVLVWFGFMLKGTYLINITLQSESSNQNILLDNLNFLFFESNTRDIGVYYEKEKSSSFCSSEKGILLQENSNRIFPLYSSYSKIPQKFKEDRLFRVSKPEEIGYFYSPDIYETFNEISDDWLDEILGGNLDEVLEGVKNTDKEKMVREEMEAENERENEDNVERNAYRGKYFTTVVAGEALNEGDHYFIIFACEHPTLKLTLSYEMLNPNGEHLPLGYMELKYIFLIFGSLWISLLLVWCSFTLILSVCKEYQIPLAQYGVLNCIILQIASSLLNHYYWNTLSSKGQVEEILDYSTFSVVSFTYLNTLVFMLLLCAGLSISPIVLNCKIIIYIVSTTLFSIIYMILQKLYGNYMLIVLIILNIFLLYVICSISSVQITKFETEKWERQQNNEGQTVYIINRKLTTLRGIRVSGLAFLIFQILGYILALIFAIHKKWAVYVIIDGCEFFFLLGILILYRITNTKAYSPYFIQNDIFLEAGLLASDESEEKIEAERMQHFPLPFPATKEIAVMGSIVFFLLPTPEMDFQLKSHSIYKMAISLNEPKFTPEIKCKSHVKEILRDQFLCPRINNYLREKITDSEFYIKDNNSRIRKVKISPNSPVPQLLFPPSETTQLKENLGKTTKQNIKFFDIFDNHPNNKIIRNVKMGYSEGDKRNNLRRIKRQKSVYEDYDLKREEEEEKWRTRSEST